MVSGAKTEITIGRQFKQDRIDIQRLKGRLRQQRSPGSRVPPRFGTGQSGTLDPIQRLATQGDTMMGPIAFFPQAVTVVAGVIDIGIQTPDYSTRIIVLGEGGAADVLDTILNARFAGQFLVLQAVATTPITLKHLTGNIRIPSGNDYLIKALESVILFFDSTTNEWVLVAGDSGLTNPMTETLLMGGNSISQLNDIAFQEAGQNILSDAAGLHILVPTGDIQDVLINGIVEFTVRPGSIDFEGNSASDLNDILFTEAGQTIISDISGLHLNVPVSDIFEVLIGGTPEFEINATQIDVKSNTVVNFPGWTNAVGQSFVSDANGSTWSLPLADAYLYNINGAPEFTINASTIDVHDKSINSWIGWVGDVGQASAVGATGQTKDLPTGDSYIYRVNGANIFEITSIGFVTSQPANFQDYLELDEIAAPVAGTNAIRLYARDKATISELFYINSAGVERDLSISGGGGSSFDDVAFDVHDDVDVTKIHKWALENMTTGTTITLSSLQSASRTHTFPNITGTLATLAALAQTFQGDVSFNEDVNLGLTSVDLINFRGRIRNGTDIIPAVDLGSNLGDVNNAFSIGYINKLVFDITTKFIDSVGALDLEFKVPSGGDMKFFEDLTQFWRLDGGENQAIFSRDIALTSAESIRADGTGEIGFWVTNTTSSVGLFGTIQIPVDTGSAGSAANADTDFGNKVGCIGLYLSGGGTPVLVVKMDESPNTWATLTLNPSFDVAGGRLT